MVILGEGDIDVLLLTGLHADDLILKAGHKAAGTQLQTVIGAFTALKGNTVLETLKVDDSSIATLGLALHTDKTGIAVSQLLQALFHIGGSDLHLGLLSLQALVLAQRHLGIHGSGRLERKAVLRDLAHHFNSGIADNLQLLLLHSSLIGLGERNIDGLLEKHLGAIHPLDHLAGGLAGAEARNTDLPAHLLICLFNSSLKRGSVHLDGQRYHALFKFFAALNSHVCLFLRSSWVYDPYPWACSPIRFCILPEIF